MHPEISEIKNIYRSIKTNIENRIANFKAIWERGNNEELFTELAFCILTPQSKARSGWQAICSLKEKNLLFCGKFSDINKELNIVRFKNKKSEYLIEAREKFAAIGSTGLKQILEKFPAVFEKRDWLVNEVKGYGYKEASHFLRNVGFGDNIAILDRHILKNLRLFGVIKNIPESITRKKYYEIEDRLKIFSKEINIPVDHLDFVLWYKEAGEVFK
ncbi:MAG: N-glycosylase/DNA lyase [Spirochaetes bacterium]|nr:N-glycosylase/DNA lyase [Spirochaetota bacterium]